MSLFKIFDTAASGMSAQSVRLNLVASNMADVESVSSSVEQTYRSRQPGVPGHDGRDGPPGGGGGRTGGG